MKFGCCVRPEEYPLAEQFGFDGICLGAKDVAALPPPTFDKLARAVRAGRTPCTDLNCFAVPPVWLLGPAWSEETVRAYAGILLPRAARLGVQRIGVGGPKVRSIPDGFDRGRAERQFVRSMEIFCGQAGAYGIQMLLEPLSTPLCNFINTAREARLFLERYGLDEMGLLFDLYHARRMGEPPALEPTTARRVQMVHIAQEGSDGGREYLHPEHADQYAEELALLRASGCTAPVYLEAMRGDPAEELERRTSLLS